MTIQQISIFLENRAGQLAEITGILSESHIDLLAVNIAETTDYGVLRIIVDKPREAASILLGKGCILSMTPVLALTVPDKPGGLARLLTILAKENMDIEYMYSMLSGKNGLAYMIFRVADTERLEALLAANGIPTVKGEELGIQ